MGSGAPSHMDIVTFDLNQQGLGRVLGNANKHKKGEVNKVLTKAEGRALG